MTGWHYTTREAWESIQQQGLIPSRITDAEYEAFWQLVSLPRDVVWVWKRRLTPEEAWASTAILANHAGSTDLVLLEIEYDESIAASHVCKKHPDDIVKLTVRFSMGDYQFRQMPIELLLETVPPKSIKKIWEADLLEPFGD